jgi:hypothetical protein
MKDAYLVPAPEATAPVPGQKQAGLLAQGLQLFAGVKRPVGVGLGGKEDANFRQGLHEAVVTELARANAEGSLEHGFLALGVDADCNVRRGPDVEEVGL